jgi:hypothetical protein
VCIQAITPTTESSAFASSAARRIASCDVSTGRHSIVTGISSASARSAATSFDCAATCASVSSP